MNVNKKIKNKKNYDSYIKFGIYLIVILLINIVSLNLFFKMDLTNNKLYSLSKASIDSVSTLKEPMMVKIFFSKNLPAPWNNIEPYLHDLLSEYKANASNDFNYKFYPIDSKQGELSKSAEKNRKEASDYGINPINLYKAAQEEQKSLLAYMGMVIIHGDVVEKLPVIESTNNLEYKITTAIKKLNNKISSFLNMSGKITITLVQSSSMKALVPFIKLNGFDLVKGRVQNIVNELNAKTYGKLEFVFVDPSTSAMSDKLKKFDRFKMSWPRKEFEQGKVLEQGEGILALGLNFNNKSMEMKMFGTRFNPKKFSEEYYIAEDKEIKEFIDENISNLLNINDDIGYLISHGTKPLAANLPPEYRHLIKPKPGELKVLGAILNQNYNVKLVDLKRDGIPKGIDTLIIVGAKEIFTEWELFQIDQFLMEGNSIAVYADSFKELKQQQNQYQRGQSISIPNETGLLKLLEHYGLGLNKSYVLDEKCFINRDRQRGDNPIYIAPIIQNRNIEHSNSFMGNITGLVMFKNSPIKIDDKIIKANGIKLNNLFSSTDRAWELKGPMDQRSLMFSQPPTKKEEMKKFNLAIIAEGEFPSYFDGRELPKKPIKKEDNKENKENKNKKIEKSAISKDLKSEKSFISRGSKAKIFLTGSSEMLSDQIIQVPTQAGTQSQSPLFLVNLMDFLNNKEEMAILRSKVQRFNPIEKSKVSTRDFIKIFNIVGVPIIFIFIGIFVFVLRQKKRKRIETIFKE